MRDTRTRRRGYGLCGCEAPHKWGHDQGCLWQLDPDHVRARQLERAITALEECLTRHPAQGVNQ